MDSDHRRWLADDRDDAGVRLAWRSGSAIPADEDGAAPYPVGHSQRSVYTHSSGLRDTPTEVQCGHRWLFNDQEVDDDEVSYASMGGLIKSPSNVERF